MKIHLSQKWFLSNSRNAGTYHEVRLNQLRHKKLMTSSIEIL